MSTSDWILGTYQLGGGSAEQQTVFELMTFQGLVVRSAPYLQSLLKNMENPI